MKILTIVGIAVLGVTFTVAGCAEQMLSTKATDASLYDRLGGQPAITAVVDDFVGRVGKDTRINGRFANADIPQLKMRLVEQICQASGGPCTYSGRNMKTAHAGMEITNADFEALVEDLVAALNKFNVGQQEQEELLGELGSLQRDIVERS